MTACVSLTMVYPSRISKVCSGWLAIVSCGSSVLPPYRPTSAHLRAVLFRVSRPPPTFPRSRPTPAYMSFALSHLANILPPCFLAHRICFHMVAAADLLRAPSRCFFLRCIRHLPQQLLRSCPGDFHSALGSRAALPVMDITAEADGLFVGLVAPEWSMYLDVSDSRIEDALGEYLLLLRGGSILACRSL